MIMMEAAVDALAKLGLEGLQLHGLPEKVEMETRDLGGAFKLFVLWAQKPLE